MQSKSRSARGFRKGRALSRHEYDMIRARVLSFSLVFRRCGVLRRNTTHIYVMSARECIRMRGDE